MDTRDKRSSALFLTLPWRNQYPVADSAITQADRQHAARLYAGILAGPPSAAVYKTPRFIVIASARQTTIEAQRRQTVIEAQERQTVIKADGRETKVEL